MKKPPLAKNNLRRSRTNNQGFGIDVIKPQYKQKRALDLQNYKPDQTRRNEIADKRSRDT